MAFALTCFESLAPITSAKTVSAGLRRLNQMHATLDTLAQWFGTAIPQWSPYDAWLDSRLIVVSNM
jgi:hypothetical protein